MAAGVLRNFWPGSSSKNGDHEDDYSVEYSFAIEYSGPPVSHEIPQVIPVDVRRIPTATVAAKAVIMSNLSVPVLQPIFRKGDKPRNIQSLEPIPTPPASHIGKFRRSGRIYSRKAESFSEKEDAASAVNDRDGSGGCDPNVFDQSSSSSGTLGFSYGGADSNQLSGSSDVEELDDDDKAKVAYNDCSDATTCNSIEEVEEEESETEVSGQRHRPQVVTSHDISSSDQTSDGSAAMSPERPVVMVDDMKGQCHRCKKRNRLAEREVCIVCNAKYCSKCVLRAMGSMPEGRKCISCIHHRIHEAKRGSLGKCSRMLKRMLTRDTVKQIMTAELSCPVNQLPPESITVNDKPLSIQELVMLQSCPNPPKKLRPGNYWYDKVSGFWGKEGEKPCQVISPLLAVGYQLREDASNGDTDVVINGRRITSSELWLLRAAGIHCEGNPHFWITADGSCQHEGMNNVMGKLWERKVAKMVCLALSLPFPADTSNPGGEGAGRDKETAAGKKTEQSIITNKLLLVGCDQSGTSTIFKQAKILCNVPFSEDEKQSIKIIIQRNLYRYIGILLAGREHLREEDGVLKLRRRRRRQRANDEPGPSSLVAEDCEETDVFSFSRKLENFSSWLLQIMNAGNLEAIFPAATKEYSPLVEELWKDNAFQAIYRRRNELPALPRVANYFLDRAVEISRMDYEPSEMDILYSDGITSSNGVASMEFSLPNSAQDGSYMESLDQNEPPTRYQMIRVHSSSLGENCKWLEMFEDVELVMLCVSLTEYAEYIEDMDGSRSNKMMETKKFFEKIITHPTLSDKHFILILNKFDLLEEMIDAAPLSQCEWFRDFNPVMSQYPHNPNSNNNPSLAQRAFHYVGVKFKRLFGSMTEGRRLFVVRATGLEGESVDRALRYAKEILKWEGERHTVTVSMNEDSSESMEPTTSAYNSNEM